MFSYLNSAKPLTLTRIVLCRSDTSQKPCSTLLRFLFKVRRRLFPPPGFWERLRYPRLPRRLSPDGNVHPLQLKASKPTQSIPDDRKAS
ncbi:hypothetical protein LINGRAHAP2_LOCUS16533 [Linum grandiflorum]